MFPLLDCLRSRMPGRVDQRKGVAWRGAVVLIPVAADPQASRSWYEYWLSTSPQTAPVVDASSTTDASPTAETIPLGGHDFARAAAFASAPPAYGGGPAEYAGHAVPPTSGEPQKKSRVGLWAALSIVGALLLIAVIIVGGMVTMAHQKVEHAAAEASRSASLARTISQASTSAKEAATSDLAAKGLDCVNLSISTDTSGFRTRPGVTATVRTTVTCDVSLDSLGLFGISGVRTIQHTSSSPIDTYRERVR